MMTRKRIVLSLVIILLLSAGGFVFWAYRDLHKPIAHTKSAQFIEIQRGSSPSGIVQRLKKEGIIGREWPLLLYLKWTNDGLRLQAGDYRFPSPISPLAVLKKLQEGEQRTNRFTVIEGWTRWDIANAMTRVPELRLQNADEALALMDQVGPVSDLDPQASNLEGYLYPDTYSFPTNAAASDMIAAMVKRFRQQWKPEWSERARALNLTPRQVVTIASLIETEAKIEEERPLVASVIHNRLRKGMALGIDSSVIYASKLAGKWKNDGKVYQSDLDRRSPYNTRLETGLPPGPIAAPSSSSLEAALYPSATNNLYYVREPSRNDGAHNFYESEKDFLRGVQALRAWERDRDAPSAR